MGAQIREPEVYLAGERLPARDPFVEKLAWVMDGMIPLGRWSIGLDGILGLVPGLGDILGAAISMLIVLRAMQAGIPHVAIARMTTNIAIDTLVGSIPLFGDIFDFAYKSNQKNVRIYEEALRAGPNATARHWGFFIALFAGLSAVAALAVWGALAVIGALKHSF